MRNVTRMLGIASLLLILNACDKCIQCTFSYTVTKTEFTPEGEVTYTDTLENQSLPNSEGVLQNEVCGDDDEVEELRARYENGNADNEYENYNYQCTER